MKNKRKAIIFGVKGHKLSVEEKFFFKKNKPWGIILFSRNIKNILQLKNLVSEIKNVVKEKKYPILIDQEGGKVSRLNQIIDLSIFSQSYFFDLYKKNKKNFLNQYKIYINAVSSILNYVGININTVPVLDIRRKKTHNFIGSRSFSEKASNVKVLGNLCIKFYMDNKIATVSKHIPGHGLSRCDSHYKTPVITASKRTLIKNDFKPFKACKSTFAMTGHAIYEAFDKKNTATHSKIMINKVIRKYMNFDGILISDDIAMKSLNYSLNENALKALQAGCNLVLHCNGNIREMYKLAKVIPNIDNFTEKKTSDFYNFLG